MRKSTIAIGIAAALSTQAFVTTTNADAAVKHKLHKASGPITNASRPHFRYPAHPSGTVLYDQTGTPVNGAPSQNFESTFDAYDAQGADDFVVTDAAGWTVSAFNFAITATSDPSSATYDVIVYNDDGGGVPGTVACSNTGQAGTLSGGNTALSVSLSTPCTLAQGTYWISLYVNLGFLSGGQVFWSDYSPGGLGANSKWQNPGGGFGTPCSTWSDLATCTSTATPSPVGGGQTSFMFQVVGAVGGGGGTCDAGDLCLEATVGTDTSAGACATTDTIDATQGEQLNFCYRITNRTGVELDYHTLENNVDGTIFSLLNQPVPDGGTFQFNNIETVTDTATYNSTWTGQDVPPGYLAEVTTGGGGGCPDRIFADGFDGSTPPCDPVSGFIDITGSGTPLGNGDDQAIAVTMPFSFNFYGVSSNQICVDNNGFLLFNTTACPSFGFFTNVSLPSASFSAPAIMPLWDDFDSESGNVYTAVQGTTPNRQFIVEWFDRVHYSGAANTDGATFEVILNEDGTIQFEYSDVAYSAFTNSSGDPDDCTNGVCATIGLQNDATLFNEFSAFQASITDNSGILWTATNPQVFTGTDSVTVNVGAPDINVDPTSLTGTVAAGGSTSTPLDIQNLGNRDLNWTADEAGPANLHFPFGPRYAPSTVRPGETNLSAVRPSAEWLRAHQRPTKAGQQGHRPVNPLGATTPSFGCNIISFSSCDYVSFDADAPQTLTSIATQNEIMFGGSFGNNDFTKEYVVGYPSGDLETVDTTTGARTDIGPTGFGTATRDIAWDDTTGTMFGTAINGSSTDLFTVDLTTGAMSLVGTISGLGASSYVMGLAVDPSSGNMYGIEILTSSLVAIDKTNGNASVIGALGYSTRFGQGLDFNAATGTLYLASIDYSTGTQNMYTVDTGTGAASLIAPIGNNIIQLGSFAIAIPSGPCGTPTDQPWLSLNPTSGTTAGGSDTPVTVTINATGFNDGDTLAGTVCVRSNDPDEHTVAVPVEYTVGGGGPGGIVDSGVLNISVNDDFTGLYINWLTGDTCTSDSGVFCQTNNNGYDFNPFSGITFFFPSVDSGQCVVDAGGCSILASGSTVGPASTFGGTGVSISGSNYAAGNSAGFLGFSFVNLDTGVVNYGYAKFTTTAGDGFPATLVEYWYDNTGAAIAIP